MSGSTGMLSGALGVARKELLEALRDKQTVLYTVVLPICMYPIMFWAMIQAFLVVQGLEERTEVRVGLAAAVAPAQSEAGTLPELDRLFDLRQAIDPREVPREVGATEEPPVNPVRLVSAPDPGALDPEGAKAWALDQDGAPDGERLDAVLYLPETAKPTGSEIEQATAQVFYDGARSRSKLARKRIEQRLESKASDLRREAARDRDLSPGLLRPVTVTAHDTAPGPGKGALLLSTILPLLLVTMAVMGAFFPAVDLTAGEKERGTAETTMLLPLPRTAVLLGKVLATCLLAVIATTLNLFAIALSAEHLLSTLAQGTSLEIPLPLGALATILPLALLFAFFTAAILTAIAGLARSFKEGQALLGPAQMLFIVPAMIGIVPGIELNLGWALVPVVNVVLACKALLVDKHLPLEYLTVAAAQLAYAGLAVVFAVRLLSREAVALSGETLSLRRLFSLLRSRGSSA